ncbi:MAG: hypothetical protein PVI21_03750 [Candidatus Woesebacteria bacterium]|jgi:hypothetical protein
MHGLRVERLRPQKGLPYDLARHICNDSLPGKIVVVADRPLSLLSTTRKQWLRLIRRVEIERARILNAKQREEFSDQIRWMNNLRFSAKPPTDLLEADVTFATVERLVLYAPDCTTMYVTCDIPREMLHIITSWMPRRGLVVIYGQD